MVQWERDIKDLRSVLKELERQIKRSSLSSKGLLIEYSRDITGARLKVQQCLTNCLLYGSDMVSSQSSSTVGTTYLNT